MDYWEIRKAEYPKHREYNMPEDLKKRFTLITYGDKDEFLQSNPGCCKRTWDLSWSGRRRRAEGYGDGMFSFKHRVLYMDHQKGSLKQIESTSTHIMVTNCGGVELYHGNIGDPYDCAEGCE